MSTITITCIRKNGAETITTGTSRNGKVTLTGTIHDAQDLQKRVFDGSRYAMTDLSETFIGVTCTFLLGEEVAEEVLGAIENYYAENAEMNIYDPKVGITFKVKDAPRLLQGRNPKSGEETVTAIYSDPIFVETCEGYDFRGADASLIEKLTAQSAATQQGRANQAMQAMQAGLNEVKVAAKAPARKTARK